MRKYLKKISFVLALVMCVTFMSVFVSAKVSVILDTSSDSAGQYGTIKGTTSQNTETYKATVTTTVSFNGNGATLRTICTLRYASTGLEKTLAYNTERSDNSTSASYNFTVLNAYEADPELINTTHMVCGNSSEFIYKTCTELETIIPNT